MWPFRAKAKTVLIPQGVTLRIFVPGGLTQNAAILYLIESQEVKELLKLCSLPEEEQHMRLGARRDFLAALSEQPKSTLYRG